MTSILANYDGKSIFEVLYAMCNAYLVVAAIDCQASVISPRTFLHATKSYDDARKFRERKHMFIFEDQKG